MNSVVASIHCFGYRTYLLRRTLCVAFNRLNRLSSVGLTFSRFVLGKRLRFRVHDYNLCFFYCGVPTEPENEALLAALGCELGGDLIDVGANYGQLAHDLFGNFRQMALLDPNAEAATFLRSLFAGEPSISIIEAGAGESIQTGRFCFADEHQSGGSSINTSSECSGPTIAITTIDEVVTRYGLEPSVIKIDVEGFEERVLLGARYTIAQLKPVLAWEVRGKEEFESCRRLVPDWSFYRIDSTVAHGSSSKLRSAIHGLLRPEVCIRKIDSVDGFVSLLFAVHPEKRLVFDKAVSRLNENGIRF